MILSAPERIQQYTAAGWWGTETLWQRVAATIERTPEREAIVDPPNRSALCGGVPARLTYAELGTRVERACRLLQDAGIKADDRLLMQLPNVHEAAVVLLACARLGVIASPVPMQFRRHELESIVRQIQPVAGVTVAAFRGFDHVDLFVSVLGRAAPVFVVGEPVTGGARAFALDRPGLPALPVVPEPTANDILTICWTSGTESEPRAVPRSHNQWLAGGRLRETRDGEVILSGFPLVNMAAIGGSFTPWVLARGRLVLHHPFDLRIYLGQIERERVTCTSFPPPVLNEIARNPELVAGVDLSSLHTLHSGAAPLSPHALRVFQEQLGIGVTNVFGSNEGAGFNSTPDRVPDPEDRAFLFPLERLDSNGRLKMLVESRLVDPDSGEIVEQPGRPAELQIRGPTVFDGYWQGDRASAFTADGWFRTGDLLQLELRPGGTRYYRYVSRLKDLIVRGGFKISPNQIDHLLAGHPQVTASCAVGVDDPVLGERVGVAVVPVPGCTPTIESIAAYLEQRGLAKFKLPERLLVLERLPVNALGKVTRPAVRRLFSLQSGALQSEVPQSGPAQ